MYYFLHPQYSIYLNKTTKQEGTKAILVMLFLGLIITLVKKYIKIKNAAEIVLTFYNNFIYGLLIYVMFLKQVLWDIDYLYMELYVVLFLFQK